MSRDAIVALLIIGVVLASVFAFDTQISRPNQLKNFSSYEELKNFVKTNQEKSRSYGGIFGILAPAVLTGTAASRALTEKAAVDYSTTNIQVAGVDEADIVKNDDKYVYVTSGNKVLIIDAYPAESAKILSEITLGGDPEEIFINKDKLVIFGRYLKTVGIPIEPTSSPIGPTSGSRSAASSYPIYPPYSSKTFINVYDVSERENPVLTREIILDGDYFGSRMIEDYVYVVINQPLGYTEEIAIPQVYSENGTKLIADFPEIYYFDVPEYSYSFTTILSINVQDDNEDVTEKVILVPYTQNMYVSLNNIYITYTKRYPYSILRNVVPEEIVPEPEKTVIHKIAIKNGKIESEASGEVPGHILNQFSMDEYNGHFRIATTTGSVARIASQATSTNNVYVLDSNLNIVGSLEDLAPGEEIYSARFVGERGYLVTFKKIDPLFVVDLSNPQNPKVLGKLKIPGYSDYLHPYDENHIIGIGKETVEAEQGDFAWYQGIKIALFDVSDVEKPKEIAKYEIGDRGTNSYALQDHKAFLFSKQKNLLVIPILLAEIDEEKYPSGVPPSMHGEFVWQGGYVFDISLDSGFELRGRVTHIDDSSQFLKSGYYFDSDYSVKRSLYINNVLYTISEKTIKMNDLNNLNELNKVKLN